MKKFLTLIAMGIPGLVFSQMTFSYIFSNDAICNGSCDGDLEVIVQNGSYPVTIDLTNIIGETYTQVNDSTFLFTNMCAGNYNIEVTDASVTTIDSNVVVAEPPMLDLFPGAVMDVTCNGSCDGMADVMAFGGTAPYTYFWITGETTPFIAGLCAGVYDVDVIDANGCNQFLSIVINEPPAITLSTTSNDATCSTGCNGDITITATGGVGALTYSIDNGVTFQASSVFTNLCNGQYDIVVMDANGCIQTSTVTLGTPVLSSSSITHSDCGLSTGTITPGISGGIAPLTYTWVGPNGFTANTEDISNLESGPYSLTVTDDSSCNYQFNYIINDIPGTGINANLTAQDASCADGSVTANITLGTAPFDLNWSNGDSTMSINNLLSGGYSLTITDANGCAGTFNAVVNDISSGNCSSISGYVYNDDNNNCSYDGGDTPLPNRIVTANPGNYTRLTDANGYYEFNIPYGSYQISASAATGYNPSCNSSGINVTTSVGTPTFTDQDFGDTINILPDMAVYLSAQNVRPLLPTYHYLYLNNNTIAPISGTLYCLIDTSITYGSCSVAPDQINGDTLIWNISNYTGSGTFTTIYGTGPNAPLGTPLEHCAWFETAQNEVTTINNQYCLNHVVTGSYDPNDKAVIPDGDIRLKDSTLEYLVRFQNTGTDTAFTVVITDTMSNYLDLSTLEILGESHPMTYQIVNNNVLVFTFNNILLPDSNVNEPASHGYVAYKIRQQQSNVIGDVIENTANIYFDFNAPIITYTTVSPIVPKQFNLHSSFTPPACENDCNATATVDVIGDEPPFTILWNDPMNQTTATADSLCAGTYEVLVIDAENDTLTSTILIENPDALSVSSSAVDDVNMNCQGQATVTPTGGTSPYTYQWDVAAGSQTTATATGLCGGVYNVTITDSSGCSIVETVTIQSSVGMSENTALNLTVKPNPFEEQFMIELDSNSPTWYSVFNILGEQITTPQLIQGGKAVVNLAQMESGIYFVKAESNGKSRTIKVIKK